MHLTQIDCMILMLRWLMEKLFMDLVGNQCYEHRK